MLYNSSSAGGAISLSGDCFLIIDNVTIKKNSASLFGGGIYCNNSDISLINVSIHHNSAGLDGGGIYFNHNSYLTFENDKRCNIYLNNAARGKDLYNGNSNDAPVISVIVDTFTVLIPTNTLAYSTDNLTFDVLNDIADITSISNEQMPMQFSLYQNYPNPFNASTKIKFTLPVAATVTIDVYNILGQKIAILLHEYKTQGQHKVEFNGQNFSSGIYLYRIQAGAFQDVKKMTLVK
jgi:predicted outer membrane repeat protein